MRAALVTGAARRIGAEIANALARDGWHVIAHYRESGAEAQRLVADIDLAGGRASAIAADLSSEAGIDRLVADVGAATTELQLLVNNASTFAYDTIATTSLAALQANFVVNAAAPILLAQKLADRLGRNGQGSVVNILDNRVLAPNPDYFSYAVAKHALYGATRMLALALAPRIRVNAVAPGIALLSGRQSEDGFRAAHASNPLRRGTTPAEIAAAVLFIAGTPSMTGAMITLDGGQALANAGRDVAFLETD